ncbi:MULTISPECIES: hypothetical protein [Ralstonia solanacearum species complex]|uniref:hypothetical protein n=1 Tax=Ralstonia solanacearum species complex TaxID=3116862 RepID=UPI000E567B7C|nr:hypothetical protein [Ralstonia solanacearum]BEU75066.1 hypothetical protein MAFF211271_46210 [Ralstonia pseudosolanacearum]AXV79841.1 hypothetical protein CJO76_23585 [Ralstonia solanacearum]AXV93873.1 hypothetical protein CJO79_23565 [Ralstonia solanacearum]AXW21860.1 hypothetical protein CJO85_23690 [Ralstonia solanacearum]AXW78767.1 hypothetical protein CJO97_23570 [Ralstonia solanacearum]
MTQALIADTQDTQARPAFVGDLEAPKLTLLGSLDDDQGTQGLDLETRVPKPLMAIIYSGI